MRTLVTIGIAAVLLTCGYSSAPRAQQAPAAGTDKKQTAPAAPKPWPDAATLRSRREESEQRRLFRGTAPIAFTLTADFKAVMRERNPASTKTFPATMAVVNDDDTTTTVALRIRSRGHVRRRPDICDFAPLRLEFEKAAVKGTVFEGHGPLKLGTHCRSGAEQYPLREYAVYRMYNQLTTRSFRARLVKATYVDAVTQKPIGTRHGIFIEDDDDVAKRLEGRIISLPKVIFPQLDSETLTLMMVFEYMIGNTDMSIYAQHNVRLVQTAAGKRYPVPYDFDYSGVVDAAYAVPAKGLGIESVRDRSYRGPCRTVDDFKPFFEQMRSAKDSMLAIYDQIPEMTDSYRRDAKSYLNDFFKTLDRPDAVKKAFIEGCGKRIGM